jgi:hypothetical protein
MNGQHFALGAGHKLCNPNFILMPCASLIPFPDQYEIRREAADSALARQGETTTYRIDLGME